MLKLYFFLLGLVRWARRFPSGNWSVSVVAGTFLLRPLSAAARALAAHPHLRLPAPGRSLPLLSDPLAYLLPP